MAAPENAISPELLEILRCPEAVHYTDRGDDPGRRGSPGRDPPIAAHRSILFIDSG